MQWFRLINKFLARFILSEYGSIANLFKSKWSSSYRLTHSPLLNTNDLINIQATSKKNFIKPLTSKNEVSTLLVGERSSAYAGSGYEFAENQLYVAGDDSRFINWRLLARTGKLYRKKFIEERRPELWVIVDKRASMRFGTQKYLKVTQAAIQALKHLYQGQQQQLACAGIIIDETVRWYKPTKERRALNSLVKDIIAPAPPLYVTPTGRHDTNQLVIVLRQLISRAAAGSIIILLSDFIDMQEEIPATVHLLSKKHLVSVKHIIDPVELELPSSGKYQVISDMSQPEHLLDCNDENVRHQYQIKAQHWQQDIEKQLTRSGASYMLCMSNESISREKEYG